MQPLRLVIACGSITALTLIATLPWGLPSEYRFFLPLLPVVAIHFWSLRYPGLVPEWYVFMMGLSLDILTHGPLGYWSLVYLITHFLAVVSAPLADRGQLARLALFGLALGLVAAISWMISSLYFLELADAWPYATGAGLAACGAIVLIPLLHAFDPAGGGRDNTRLARGV